MASSSLTSAQWRTYYAFSSALVPVVSQGFSKAHTKVPTQAVGAFSSFQADASNHLFRSVIEEFFNHRMRQESLTGIRLILDMLSSASGCLLLTFSPKAYYVQTQKAREEAIQKWLNPRSWLPFPPVRSFAQGLAQLTKLAVLSCCPEILYPALDFHPRTAMGQQPICRFEFMEFDGPTEVEIDVVIVGSGCGGAVAAKELSEKGARVIVVEKGVWVPTDELPLSEVDSIEKLFENNLLNASESGSISVLSGSTLGGGGTVNWCASLQTQAFVRKEWAENHHLPFFLSQDFQNCLDRVCDRMGVNIDKSKHNHRNTTLLSGARKLGYNVQSAPQNAPPDHECGECSFGCGAPFGVRKMGTTQTWLPDAAGAGCRFIQNFDCDKIIFADSVPKKAIGVMGTWGSSQHQITIKAKHVVVSAGSLHSPMLLHRSGLTNPHIGRNLYLHPTSPVHGVFSEPTRPGEGSPLTVVCNEFENQDHHGHGVKLEAIVMSPVITMCTMPWHSGSAWKENVLNFNQTASFIPLCRDEHPGKIVPDQRGRPRIIYDPAVDDRKRMLEGVLAISRILFIEGATKIIVPVHGVPPFIRRPLGDPESNINDSEEFESVQEVSDPGILDRDFQHWCSIVAEMGLPCPGTQFASAHQMGTCRMSAMQRDGVVDYRGSVWGVSGLSVADASVFPSASGVNPMITTMAISSWISSCVAEVLDCSTEL